MTRRDVSPTPSKRSYYMHTLDYIPATFYPRQGVLYGVPITLAKSLRQIRREQKESRSIFARKKMGEDIKYGYRRVVLP